MNKTEKKESLKILGYDCKKDIHDILMKLT